MPRAEASITPEAAKAVLKEIGGKNINALARELKERGTPVSLDTLYRWKKQKWRSKPGAIRKLRTKQETALGDAIDLSVRVGLPQDALTAMRDSLKAMSDGDLLVNSRRDLWIYSSVILAQTLHASDFLLKTDPRAFANILLACTHMVEGGQELMRESRRLAAMSSRNDFDPDVVDVTPQSTSPQPAAAEQPAPPRILPYGNLAARLRLVARTPDPVAEVIVPPKANGNGHDH